jgi:hypothetical protein
MSKIKGNWLWVGFALFLIAAFYTHNSEPLFFSSGDYGLGKPIVWLIWLAFFIYTVSINRRENFFKSLRDLRPYLWHRQISLDLYIGLLIPLFIIYLHEGSLLVWFLWFVPILIFANLATLVYLALNYDSLVTYFIA